MPATVEAHETTAQVVARWERSDRIEGDSSLMPNSIVVRVHLQAKGHSFTPAAVNGMLREGLVDVVRIDGDYSLVVQASASAQATAIAALEGRA